MRKRLLVLGVFILVIGFLILLFAGIGYSSAESSLNSLQGQIGLAFANQTEINQINQSIGELIGFMALGGILLIVGAVVTGLGFAGKRRKDTK